MLGLALSALRQHRLRTVLTTLGVVFGTLVLTASVSIGLGVDRAMQTLLQENEFLRQIQVNVDWQGAASDKTGKDAVKIEGKMSEARRERLAKAVTRRKARLTGELGEITILSREKLAELAALKHVESVMPFVWQEGYAVFEGKSQMTDIAGARPSDVSWRSRIVAGEFIDTERQSAVVVSEALLYPPYA